ncbi:MAG: uL22 family ribosomal protein [Rhizobium sp.]|nr:uL22 family ribosomal protein [Rhizobium sp.]
MNLVAAQIRGKKVDKALAELEFSRKRIAGTVKKTLETRHRQRREQPRARYVDALVVAEAYVGESLVMKRFHAPVRAAGHRASRSRSRT